MPDKFIIDYPVGNRVLDTGWRGSAENNGDPLYPGGIIGGGNDEVLGAFSRESHDSFQVTVIGPDAGTICKSRLTLLSKRFLPALDSSHSHIVSIAILHINRESIC